jgi:ribonuclease G
VNKLKRDVIFEAFPGESRVAVREDERLVELFWTERQGQVGKIYKAVVRDVVPGLSCAFVDIGLNKNAFLYFGDVAGGSGPVNAGLKRGQNILVQVRKEALAEKGARVTGFITLPGHFLVLLPFQDEIMVSRKIEDDAMRDGLRDLVRGLLPPGLGAILRTVCADAEPEDIVQELHQLLRQWEVIQDHYQNRRAPAAIYEDADVLMRTLRDYLDANTGKIILNDANLLESVQQYRLRLGLPATAQLICEAGGLFDKYGLDQEITRALRRKVWLKSGGYLVFDQTEALTVIDINTGKFVGKDDFAATIFTVNAEAAAEIPRQIRLRGLGGIILVDFIDMQNPEHAAQVLDIFRRELEQDKAHTQVLGLTRLGLLEMTRKKSRYGLSDIFTAECAACHGSGRLSQVSFYNYAVKSQLLNTGYLEGETIICAAHPDIVASVEQDQADLLYISQTLGKKIRLQGDFSLQRGEYRFSSE